MENKKLDEFLSKLSDEQLNSDFNEIYRVAPKSEQVLCSSNQNSCLQKFATKKWLVVVYGLLTLVFASSGSYFGGTITTLEKRFKIPSKNLGLISTGNDISSLFLTSFIAYYGGKQHRPRFIGLGLFLIACHCFLNALPHFIYGGGSEALALTKEYDQQQDFVNNSIIENDNEKLLCRPNRKL
jgi:solute carrier organic anion transporter family, member 5A